MYCNSCEQNPCTCQKPAAVHQPLPRPQVRSTYQPLPEGISLEEFGPMLFETIKLIGGMSGLQAQIATAIHEGKGYKVQGFKERRESLKVTLLKQHLALLTPDERTQIFDRYPWVEVLS